MTALSTFDITILQILKLKIEIIQGYRRILEIHICSFEFLNLKEHRLIKLNLFIANRGISIYLNKTHGIMFSNNHGNHL